MWSEVRSLAPPASPKRDVHSRLTRLRVWVEVRAFWQLATNGGGMRRLWRGVSTMVMAAVPAHAAYFSIYEAGSWRHPCARLHAHRPWLWRRSPVHTGAWRLPRAERGGCRQPKRRWASTAPNTDRSLRPPRACWPCACMTALYRRGTL